MGSEMPDWAKLWEREPGLKPEHLSVGKAGCLWLNLTKDDRYETAVSAELAAALCRDAAVRWLWKYGFRVEHQDQPDGSFGSRSPFPFVLMSGKVGHEVGGFSEGEALFAACLAVLAARDSALSARAGEGSDGK